MQPEVKWLMDYFDARALIQDMQDTLDTLQSWVYMDHGYKSKNDRIFEWSPDSFQLTEIVYHIFAGTLLHPQGMTYQAMIGYIAGNIGCKEPLDRAKCAAEVIAIAYLCELIVITKVSDKTMLITTNHQLEVEIPAFHKHLPQFQQPESVSYIPILGNRFKKHDGDVCLDHINRMNAIPLSLDQRVISMLPETTNELETQEQIDAWEAFVKDSQQMYLIIQSKGNRFHLNHHNDTRGRCYCEGYYINYQGSSYKKAIVQLANKEVVRL